MLSNCRDLWGKARDAADVFEVLRFLDEMVRQVDSKEDAVFCYDVRKVIEDCRRLEEHRNICARLLDIVSEFGGEQELG